MASRRTLHDVVIWLARLAVAATFIGAAVPKILDPVRFAADIAAYQVFPHQSWNLLAVVVPMLELVASVCLLVGWKRRGAALILGALAAAFVVLIAWVIYADIDVACGCFGAAPDAPPAGWPELVRDVVLVAGAVVAARRTARETSPDS